MRPRLDFMRMQGITVQIRRRLYSGYKKTEGHFIMTKSAPQKEKRWQDIKRE